MAKELYGLELIDYNTTTMKKYDDDTTMPVVSRNGTAEELLPYAKRIVAILERCAVAADDKAESDIVGPYILGEASGEEIEPE